jgi:hypothetical protein
MGPCELDPVPRSKQVGEFMGYFNYQLLRNNCALWSKLKQLDSFKDIMLIARIFC